MKVLKFGGSSIGTTVRIKSVVEIIINSKKTNGDIAVVFSAFQGVTDQLIEMGRLAAEGQNFLVIFNEIKNRHLVAVGELIASPAQDIIKGNVKYLLAEMFKVLNGISLIKECTARTLDQLLGFGERLSAYIICQTLNNRGYGAEFLDSRLLIKTDDSFGHAKVNYDLTYKNIREYFEGHKQLQIITGFIASTNENETTTLGRGGSDLTASIFGAGLEAGEIEIWTDVNGVMTADPRKVKKAFPIKTLTYEEAMEMSHFGARVIYPATMQPALNKNIPLRIKNTFEPAFPGTIIACKNGTKHFSIKGISSIDDIAIIRIQGSGLIGGSGIAERIFSVLAARNINVFLITQASSEYSLCMAMLPFQADIAKVLIEEELRFDIRDGLINEIIIEKGLSIIAVVGGNMRDTPGVCGKVFQALSKNGINIIAIAYGSSELNISAVIRNSDVSKALNALHDTFFLSPIKSLNVFLIGTGLIGGTLLDQIKNQTAYLAEKFLSEIKIVAAANSRKMIFDTEGILVDDWKNKLHSSGEATNLDSFIRKMKKLNLPNSIFIDCTASQEVTEKYLEILESSISVVTPNKRANSGTYECYQNLKRAALHNNVKFLYETNVGAGLPVINTLNDLVSSGDSVIKIEGILSGTLSYLFNSFNSGQSFSSIVNNAKLKGYTEPDPREDLNGQDVARKILILAREAGFRLEMNEVEIESLVPEELRSTSSVTEFLKRFEQWDDQFRARQVEAMKNGRALRYIAEFKNGKAKISLKEIDNTHPFYSISGSDNIIAFTTERYKERPIVIKGPGAGAEVTAAGVFSDVLRIAHHLS